MVEYLLRHVVLPPFYTNVCTHRGRKNVAVITGVGSGVAERLSRGGRKVVLAGRTMTKLEATTLNKLERWMVKLILDVDDNNNSVSL
jgi:NADP-dependent 3-hydroxy acid dehydrogenase YdfG